MRHASPPPARIAAQGQRIAAAEAHWRAGLAQAEMLDWSAAERSFERAVELSPRDRLFWTNLANAQRKRGEFARASESARKAFALDRSDTLACKLYANCLMEQHRWDDAIRAFASLAPQAERDHHFHLEYGQAFYHAQRLQEAAAQFVESFTFKPDYVPAHARLANTLALMGLHREAAECYRTVALLAPGDGQALSNVVHQSQHACDWGRVGEDTLALNHAIETASVWRTTPFAYLAMDSTMAQQRRAAEIFARSEFGAIRPLAPASRGPRPAGERIRVGYLSCDFHHHATSMLLVDALEQHDREKFEVTLYSYSRDDRTDLRRRVVAASEHFVEGGELSDRDLAQRIRDDGIDVLVDLKAYTRGTRSHVLAYRPAPIQAQYLGYPGTMGCDFVDYVIGDPTVTPLEHAPHYSERIAQLPRCYQPNDRRRALPDPMPRWQCGLPDTAFVFCCFNSNYKITEAVFDRWCRILFAVPGSVLWLFEANAQAKSSLLAHAARKGVDASRFVFAPFLGISAHLARLRNADLFLDTLPYNAHTTGSDALWAGVPLLTCVGDTFAGRVAASLLRAVGTPELVTASLDEYESRAIALATDRAGLAALRRRLDASRRTAPLFDGERSARDLESLYLRMVERQRAGLAPDHLPS